MKVLVSYPAPCDRHAWGNAWAWHLIYPNISKYLSTRRDPVCMNTKTSLHGCRMEPAQLFVPIFVKLLSIRFTEKLCLLLLYFSRHLRRNNFGFNVQRRVQRLGDRGFGPPSPGESQVAINFLRGGYYDPLRKVLMTKRF